MLVMRCVFGTVTIGLLTLLLLPGVTRAQVVRARGFSFFEPGQELIARQKALDEAKRAALEQAVGATVETRTAVENYQVVKDQIFTHASGYFKAIRILEEKPTELGTFEVTIEADIEFSALVADFDRLQELVGWQQNPRIGLLLEPHIDAAYRPTAHQAAALLTTHLTAGGLKVFLQRPDNAAQMGLTVGIGLDLATHRSDYQGVSLAQNEIILTTNIYRPVNGEILASAVTVAAVPGENRLQAVDKGARQCVDQAWKRLRRDLIRLWETELYSQRELHLTIDHVTSLEQANTIKEVLAFEVDGMVAVDLVAFAKSTADYTLLYRGWPQQFLNTIQLSAFRRKHFDVRVDRIQGNRLTVSIP